MAGPIRISILANASQAKKEVGGLAGTFKKTLGVAGAAFGGAAIVGGIKSIVSAASDAQQSLGGTQAVFGKYADQVVKDSDRAASAFGLSANSYRESANLIGSLLKNQGVTQKDLASSTKDLVKTGADLAATYGGTAKSAVEALGSAFKGEFDPLQQYGITLKQSTVNAEAMRLAHVKSTSAFNKLSTAQQQALQRQATQNLIAKQSTDAADQFSKQTNTLAEQQQILGAKFDNVKVKLGTFLLPILTKVMTFLSGPGLAAVQDFGDKLGDKLAPGIDKVKEGFEKAKPFIDKVINFIKQNPETVATFGGVLLGLSVTVGIVTAAVTLFNAALAVNPITLAVIALAALAAGLVYLYKHSQTARTIMDAAFAGIKAAIQLAWNIIEPLFKLWVAEIKLIALVAKALWNNAFQPTLKFIVNGISFLLNVWAGMLRALGKVPGFGWADKAADSLQTAADKAHNLAQQINDIPTHKDFTLTTHVVTIGGVTHGVGGHTTLDLPGNPRSASLLLTTTGPVNRTMNITVNSPVGSDPYTIGEQLVGFIREFEAGAV